MINHGLSPDDYFEKVGLPIGEPEDPESLIPEKPFWYLINMVAVSEGIPDFGVQVAQIRPWHKIESLSPLLSGSTDLQGLLSTFCDVAGSQTSQSRFLLEEDEADLWFSNVVTQFINNDIQMELYRITSMIQLVRLATGPGWDPEQIQLLMAATDVVQACQPFMNSEISFSRPKSRISVPRNALELPVKLETRVTRSAIDHFDINADFVGAIRQIIGVYIISKRCDIDLIAGVADVSVRTLQRRLKQHNSSFHELLDQARFDLAKVKLEDPVLTISEIALLLGYSDLPHFSRAFSRWAGMSPRQFRTALRA